MAEKNAPHQKRTPKTGDDALKPLLEVQGLQTYFYSEAGVAKAVDGVSYSILPGETLGVVGESGSGKSVTALSIMRLLPQPPGKITGGKILFQGKNLLDLDEDGMRHLRGNDIAMIFQEPMTALNPVYTVGDQIMEAVMLHQGKDKAAAREHAIDMIRKVGIPSPEERVDNYPHEMSGGMRQRIMIAMAMACDPALLIADEPTTALDVTIQAQILDLIRDLQKETGMSVLLITHDLGVVAETAHHVAVMYAGRVVEFGKVKRIFENPSHPYTIGLLRSLPDMVGPGERLTTIPGTVPSAERFPSGCRFRTRCPLAAEKCAAETPPLQALPKTHPDDGDHMAACFFLDQAQEL